MINLAVLFMVASVDGHGSMVMPLARNSIDASPGTAWSGGKHPMTGTIEPYEPFFEKVYLVTNINSSSITSTKDTDEKTPFSTTLVFYTTPCSEFPQCQHNMRRHCLLFSRMRKKKCLFLWQLLAFLLGGRTGGAEWLG